MKKIVLAIFLIINNIALTQNELKHTIYFDTGAYNIPSIEKNRLLIFINNLDSLEIEKISIYGFCDDIGSDAFNLKLSQQRADAIKKLLSNNEIDDSKISNVDGKGEILLNIENTKDINNIRGLHRRADVVVFLSTAFLKFLLLTETPTFNFTASSKVDSIKTKRKGYKEIESPSTNNCSIIFLLLSFSFFGYVVFIYIDKNTKIAITF
jgi:hypothetical protein